MPNISFEPIRWHIDSLESSSKGLVISNGDILNFTKATEASCSTLASKSGNGTSIFFMWRINGKWGSIDRSSGTFIEHSEFTGNYAPDWDFVMNYGNNILELPGIQNFNAFIGQNVGVIIAFEAQDTSSNIPQCRLQFNCKTDTQLLTASQISVSYDIGDSQIISISPSMTTPNGSSVILSVRTTDSDGNSSDWITTEKATGLKAQHVQFKADYTVPSVGSEPVCLNAVDLVYANNDSLITGLNSSELISSTENWYMGIKACRLTLKHSPLTDSKLVPFVSLRAAPSQVFNEQLGLGSGARKTFQLEHPEGLKYDSIKLYYDGVQIYSDFEVNSQIGRVTCEAPEGVIVSASYEYGWTPEIWQAMQLRNTLSYDDYDQSEYYIALTGNTYSICAVKIQLIMQSGTIHNEYFGIGESYSRSYKLNKHVLSGLSIRADTLTLPRDNWLLSEDNSQYVSVNADLGVKLYANYDWISETPEIYQFAAVFSK